MKTNCKKCKHSWETEDTVHICPFCGNVFVDDKKDISEIIKERCQNIIKKDKYIDYLAISPQLLQLIIVAFSEAENIMKKTNSPHKAKQANDILDNIKDLVSSKIIPFEMALICSRLSESYFKQTSFEKQSLYSEKDIQDYLISNWKQSILCDFDFIEKEYEIKGIGRIDILAKEKISNRRVVIEIKKNMKDGFRQLYTYARSFDDPILINISTKKIKTKRTGIEYLVFDDSVLEDIP